MYLTVTDPQLFGTLQEVEKKEFSLIHTKTPSSRESFLANLLTSQLEKQKSILYVVPSLRKASDVTTLLSRIGIRDVALQVQRGFLGGSFVSQFSTILEGHKDYDPIHHKISKHKAQKSIDELLRSYGLLEASTFQMKSWKSLSQFANDPELNKAVKLFKQYLPNGILSYNDDEYLSLRSDLKEAIQWYKKEFDIIQKHDNLNTETFVHYDLDELKLLLSHFGDECHQCQLTYAEFLDDYSQDFYQRGIARVSYFQELLKELAGELDAFIVRYNDEGQAQHTGLKKIFTERLSGRRQSKIEAFKQLNVRAKELISSVERSEEFELDTDFAHNEELSIAQIADLIDSATNLIKNWRESISDYQNYGLNQVNGNNTEVETLARFESDVEKLLQDLNDSAIFVDRIEDTTFSLVKKAEFINDVKKQIDQALWLFDDKIDYLTWKVMSCKFKKETFSVISAMKFYPVKAWIRLFDQFYIQEVALRNHNLSIPANKLQVDLLLSRVQRYRDEIVPFILHQVTENRQQVIEAFKKNRPEHFNAITRIDKSQDINTMAFYQENYSYLTNLFPITIIPEEEFSLLHLQQINYDLVVVQNMNEYKHTKMDHLSDQGKNFVYLYDEEYLEPELNNRTKVLDMHLENSNLPFDQLDLKQRVEVATSLESMMSEFDSSLRTFQTRDYSILSYMSSHNNAVMLELLKSLRIKEIHLGAGEKSYLGDIFMDTDKQIIICTEDGLFNSKNEESVEWQCHILDILNEKGTLNVNIWSSQILFGNHDSLKNQLRNIIAIPKTIHEDLVEV